MDIRSLDNKEILDAQNLFRASFISMCNFELDSEKRDNFEKYLTDIQAKGSYIGIFEKDLDGAICYDTYTFDILMIASRNEESALKNQFILKLFPFWGCLNPLMVEAYSGFIMIK